VKEPKAGEQTDRDQFSGRGRWLKIESEEVVLPNGHRTILDVVRHPGASAIIPFLSNGDVVLMQQFRHAAGGTIWEVPAGTLDPGEVPADCALRELEEETGYRAGHLQSLGSILTTPGFTDERIHLFEASDLTAVSQRLEADEVIELIQMPFKEAIELVWSGQMVDAKSALTILRAAHRRGLLGDVTAP
jgi:ADP-ribose pyrophosphatase